MPLPKHASNAQTDGQSKHIQPYLYIEQNDDSHDTTAILERGELKLTLHPNPIPNPKLTLTLTLILILSLTLHPNSNPKLTPNPLIPKPRSPVGWIGSRVVSVLDSGAEGPGFKSQPRRRRVTVLGKLFTPIVPLFTKQRNW